MAFSSDELKAVIVLGMVSGLIVSFRDLLSYSEGHVIVTTEGLSIAVLGMLGMIISVFIHEWGHKIAAGAIGYVTNIESYYPGQVLGVILAVFSFGNLPFFTPNTADLEAVPSSRMSKHRKFENFRQQAFIACSGIIFTAILATLLRGAYIASGSELLWNLMLGNMLLMVYSLVPFELLSLGLLRFQQKIDELPESDGLYIMHYSLVAFMAAVVFSVVLGGILLVTASGSVWTAVAIGLGAFVVLWFKYAIESL
jgi:hypothetical protein